MLAEISYRPVPIFEVGPLDLSLHGLFAGIGFLAGAWLFLREAARRGFDQEKITSVLTWALVGSMLGARYFTVPAHIDEGWVEALRPFPGTFSIMGGFAGGILTGWWRFRKLDMDLAAHFDMASFGLALGAVVGRIGDLFIVEHLGGRTNFFLGYRVKPGYDLAPQHDGLEALCAVGDCGPYHHAALYDLLGALVLLGVLYLLARRWQSIRYGVLFFLWISWYGFQRFLIDFTRNTELPGADATAGPLTWSQWTGVTFGVLALVVVVWLVRNGRSPVVSPEEDVARGAVPAA